MDLFFYWLYTDSLFRLSSMLSETNKTTGLFDALFGRLSAKDLSSRETSKKQRSSIAINGILTGSDFAPIPWFPIPGLTALRVHILLKYFEEFLSQTHLFFLAWIVLILKGEQGIIQYQP